MEKIPSAKSFIRQEDSISYGFNHEDKRAYDEKVVINKMKEFAKLHVQAQQEAIIKNIELEDITRPNCDDHTPYYGACITCGKVDNPDVVIGAKVKEDSIINAYPLTNIK